MTDADRGRRDAPAHNYVTAFDRYLTDGATIHANHGKIQIDEVMFAERPPTWLRLEDGDANVLFIADRIKIPDHCLDVLAHDDHVEGFIRMRNRPICIDWGNA